MSAYYDCIDYSEFAEPSCRPGACGHRRTVQVARKRQAECLAGGYTDSADDAASDIEWFGMMVGACEATAGELQLRKVVVQLLAGRWQVLDADALVASARALLT